MRPSDSPLAHQPQAQPAAGVPDADKDAVPAAEGRTSVEYILVAALVVIAALLLAVLLAIRTLTIETKRVACYARLHFITESELDRSSPRAIGEARLCEGRDPLIEYRDPAFGSPDQ